MTPLQFLLVIIQLSAVTLAVQWILALLISSLILKLNFQKITNTSLDFLASIKVVLVPTLLYILTVFILKLLLNYISFYLLSGDLRLFMIG